jgi:peptide deformylase
MLDIVLYPEDILRKKTEDIEEITPDIIELTERMFDTMYRNDGVGLAAPQVGYSLNLAVIDLSVGVDPSQKLVIINPEIIETEGIQSEEEGCLSFPGILARVDRPVKIKVRAMNLNGETFEVEGDQLLARAFAHEIDHLKGILFIDHLKGLEKNMILKKIKKLQKENLWMRAS